MLSVVGNLSTATSCNRRIYSLTACYQARMAPSLVNSPALAGLGGMHPGQNNLPQVNASSATPLLAIAECSCVQVMYHLAYMWSGWPLPTVHRRPRS